MKKLVTAVSMGALVLGVSTLAFADHGKKFQPARTFIETSGVQVIDAWLGKDFSGREALVLTSDMNVDEVVRHFKNLFLSGEKINGQRVVGIAHVVTNDTWNISIREGTKLTTFKVAKDKRGSRLTIRRTIFLKRSR